MSKTLLVIVIIVPWFLNYNIACLKRKVNDDALVNRLLLFSGSYSWTQHVWVSCTAVQERDRATNQWATWHEEEVFNAETQGAGMQVRV